MSKVGISNGPFYVRRPLLVIEALVATAVIFGGLYIVSPFFIPAVSSSSGAIFASFGGWFAFRGIGVAYLLPGLTVWYGVLLDNRRVRKWGMLGIFLVIFFFQVLSVLVNGWRPITWLYPTAVSIISAYCWLVIRWEDRHG